MEIIELVVSTDVLGLDEEYDDYIVPDGAVCEVVEFIGSACYSSSTVIALVWDYGTINQENLWIIRGYGKAPALKKVIGNGVKKLALVCCNASLTQMSMSGRVVLKVI